jgi:manganese transport protein
MLWFGCEIAIAACDLAEIIGSAIALNLAFLVNAAILILAASVFFANGMHEVAEITDAHRLLSSILGNKIAPIIFAVALIASGQSSTISGTLAGQIIMEGYLDLKIKPWKRRLLTRSLAIIPAVFTLLFFGENKLTALLILSQVILSMQLGFAIIPLIHFVSSKNIMKEFAIKLWVKILAWITALIILFLNIQLVWNTCVAWFSEPCQTPMLLLKYFVVTIFITAFFLLIYITLHPFYKKYFSKNVE